METEERQGLWEEKVDSLFGVLVKGRERTRVSFVCMYMHTSMYGYVARTSGGKRGRSKFYSLSFSSLVINSAGKDLERAEEDALN